MAAGSALGVAGPNGAGKSTLIRLLLGYLRPTAGLVRIDDLAPRQYAERSGVGYVPERIEIPPRWSVLHALNAYAALGEVEEPHDRAELLMGRLGLESLAHRRVSALSKGNLQRLAIAQALLGQRKLLILDEPTDGIDPEWTARIRDILSAWRAEDPERVLIFASHNLDEVERVCDRVAVLSDGRIREMIELTGDSADLKTYRLEVEGDLDRVEPLVKDVFPGAAAVEAGWPTFVLPVTDLSELNHGLAELLTRGIVVRSLAPEHASLESRFMRSLTPEVELGK